MRVAFEISSLKFVAGLLRCLLLYYLCS